MSDYPYIITDVVGPKYSPTYIASKEYAELHNELEQFNESMVLSSKCAKSIDYALSCYNRYSCLPYNVLDGVIDTYGFDRVLFVLCVNMLMIGNMTAKMKKIIPIIESYGISDGCCLYCYALNSSRKLLYQAFDTLYTIAKLSSKYKGSSIKLCYLQFADTSGRIVTDPKGAFIIQRGDETFVRFNVIRPAELFGIVGRSSGLRLNLELHDSEILVPVKVLATRNDCLITAQITYKNNLCCNSWHTGYSDADAFYHEGYVHRELVRINCPNASHKTVSMVCKFPIAYEPVCPNLETIPNTKLVYYSVYGKYPDIESTVQHMSDCDCNKFITDTITELLKELGCSENSNTDDRYI